MTTMETQWNTRLAERYWTLLASLFGNTMTEPFPVGFDVNELLEP